MSDAQDAQPTGFYPPDDPRSYRHPSNANPGQANSVLSSDANDWLKGRIRVTAKGLFLHIVPEVVVQNASPSAEPGTGVPPSPEDVWTDVRHVGTGRRQQRRVIRVLPGARGRLVRGLREVSALMKARALLPEIVLDEGISIPDSDRHALEGAPAPLRPRGDLLARLTTVS